MYTAPSDPLAGGGILLLMEGERRKGGDGKLRGLSAV